MPYPMVLSLGTHFWILQMVPLIAPMISHQKVHCLGVQIKSPAVGPTCGAFLRLWFIAWGITSESFRCLPWWFQLWHTRRCISWRLTWVNHFWILQMAPLIIPMMTLHEVHCIELHLMRPAVEPTRGALLMPAWGLPSYKRLKTTHPVSLILWLLCQNYFLASVKQRW